MVRIAHERIADLFGLAERASGSDHPELADRYVRLARRIGMRYNVRLLREYRELYCRDCSSFWVEGRTVRTRLRSGHRVRTCLVCKKERRVALRGSGAAFAPPADVTLRPALRPDAALVEEGMSEEEETPEDPSQEP